MNAATLSHASGRDDSVTVLWEDTEHVFCKLLQKMPRAIGTRSHPSSPAPSIRRSESINRLAREYELKEYFDGA